MKVVAFIVLAMAAASCAEEQKKPEKRGLIGLGYGAYPGLSLRLAGDPTLSHAPTFTLSHAPTLSVSHAPTITISHAPVTISSPSISHAPALSVSAPTVAHAPSVAVATPTVAHAPSVSVATPAVSHEPLTTISQVSYDTTHYTPVLPRASSAPVTLSAAAPAAPSLVYSQDLALGYAPAAPALALGYGHGIDYGFSLNQH